MLRKTINCRASSLLKRQLLFRWTNGLLTNGKHTLRILNLDGGHPCIDICDVTSSRGAFESPTRTGAGQEPPQG